MMLLLLLAQEEGARTSADAPNAMGAHTWFIILAAGAFLAWSISYSLQLRREALARLKGREELVRRREELLDQIEDLQTQNEAGTIPEKRYKQELKELKFHLARVLEKIKTTPSGRGRPKAG